jgi:transcriptional regulator with GAF, ATPase, and Fis domain
MALLSIYRWSKIVSQHKLGKRIVTLGRSSQCDVVLSDKDVSALHANIVNIKKSFQLVDLNSTNGTFHRNKKISSSFLEDQDTFRIGHYNIMFREKDDPEVTSITRVSRDYIQQSQEVLAQIREKHLTPSREGTDVSSAGRLLEKSIDELNGTLVNAQKAYEQLKIVYDLANAINSAKGFESVLRTVLDQAIKTTNMERGAIVLYNEKEELEPIVSVGMEKEVEKDPNSILSFSVIKKALDDNKITCITNIKKYKELSGAQSIVARNIKASVCMPLKTRNKKIIGALYLDSRFGNTNKSNMQRDFLSMFSIFTATAIETRQAAQREKTMAQELAASRERDKYRRKLKQLESENKRLVKKAEQSPVKNILGVSAPMKQLFHLIEKFAPSEMPVLITGETGTGKTLVARNLHDLSRRSKKPLITIDCAAIPSELLESELFGYEKGAFTGALSLKKGRMEAGEEGTLFLDEIGDMPLSLQVKLLRFLQEKRFERVGGTRTLALDVRIIAASNRDLKRAVTKGSFREDLFYRLCGATIHVPPLRERGEDIILLANSFLNDVCEEHSLSVRGFSPEARNTVLHYPWKGNVRELINIVQRSAILCEGDFIKIEDLSLESESFSKTDIKPLKQVHETIDRKLIKQALFAYKGNLSRMARKLGISRSTLRELMKKYKIKGLK